MEYTNAIFANDYAEEEEQSDTTNNNILQSKREQSSFEDDGIKESALMEQFYNSLRENNIKEARRLLRTYDCFGKLNTRQLNKDYPLNGYKFTKRGDALTLYKPIEKVDKEPPKEESTNEIANRLTELEEQLNDYANRHTHEIRNIRNQVFNNLNSVKEISNVLNMAVDTINGLLNQK